MGHSAIQILTPDAPWSSNAPWDFVYPLKIVFWFLKGRKCSQIKGLSIDTTHLPPSVPLDTTFKHKEPLADRLAAQSYPTEEDFIPDPVWFDLFVYGAREWLEGTLQCRVYMYSYEQILLASTRVVGV